MEGGGGEVGGERIELYISCVLFVTSPLSW